MNETQIKPVAARWLERLPGLRLPACLAALSAAMLLALLPVAFVARARHEAAGLEAALVACLVCWAGSVLSLALTSLVVRFAGANGPLTALALGMVFNFALPLVCGLALDRTSPELSAAGVFALVVVFFEVSLVAHTLLQLCLLKALR